MENQQVQSVEEDFVLVPPASIRIPTEAQAQRTIVQLPPEVKNEVDAKVAGKVNKFVSRVSAADLRSDEFRDILQRAFSAGRAEIADTDSFIKNNPFLNK